MGFLTTKMTHLLIFTLDLDTFKYNLSYNLLSHITNKPMNTVGPNYTNPNFDT